MDLSSQPMGYIGTIKDLKGPDVLVLRLQELGFAPGERVEVFQKLLSGDPIIVTLRDATVALRKNEAQCVLL